MNSRPIRFACAGAPLIGMLHPGAETADMGVLIMVAGGPQYRIGGHRQLVLWSRAMSAAGFPVFRFDSRGMGDSYGDYPDFEAVEPDIRAALDCFFEEVPTLKKIVLWGECNACSAALFFAHKDPRVKGIAMLNPWVRTEGGAAKTVIKHYYLQRLMERSFWNKVARFEFDLVGSVRSAARLFKLARRAPADRAGTPADGDPGGLSLPDRMLHGLSRFQGKILLIMSGRDLVPKEFDEVVKSSPAWQRELAAHGVVRHDLIYADHTFSTSEWRDQVIAWGIDWLQDIRDTTGGVRSAARQTRNAVDKG